MGYLVAANRRRVSQRQHSVIGADRAGTNAPTRRVGDLRFDDMGHVELLGSKGAAGGPSLSGPGSHRTKR